MASTDLVEKPAYRNQHPPEVTKQKQLRFLYYLSLTGQFRASCEKAGCDYSMPYIWASKGAHFAKRLEEARAKGEKVLLDRYEQQIDKRVFVGAKDPQSAVLTMFRTKRLDPRYRDNALVNVNASGPVAIQVNLNASIQPTQVSEQAEKKP